MAKLARVRTFKQETILAPEDVRQMSDWFLAEFPEAVYFQANYISYGRLPPMFPADKPIEFFPNLYDGVMRFKLPRPEICIRWPWPEELATGDPERLIGARNDPKVNRSAAEYRVWGRCVNFLYDSLGYVDGATYQPQGPGSALAVEYCGSLPAAAYPPFSILSYFGSRIYCAFDSNDPETVSFFRKVANMWRRSVSKKVALYDLMTGDVVDENYRGLWVRIGKCALANAIDGTRRFPEFGPVREGSAVVIGPRPKKPRKASKKVN